MMSTWSLGHYSKTSANVAKIVVILLHYSESLLFKRSVIYADKVTNISSLKDVDLEINQFENNKSRIPFLIQRNWNSHKHRKRVETSSYPLCVFYPKYF